MFKKICLIIAILIIPSLAFSAGWIRNIHAEWEYTAPEDLTITGFRLYQNGAKVCDFNGALLTSGDCTVTLTKRTTNFTLTAVASDNTESPHSDVYPFLDWGPKAKINRIRNK